jgi:Peptidase family M28
MRSSKSFQILRPAARAAFASAALLASVCAFGSGDPPEPLSGTVPTDGRPPAWAPSVARADVRLDELRTTDLALVGCGTRHSLSSWSDPDRGIGCGRDRILARFRQINASSGGRLEISVDRFEVTAPRTGDRPAPLENVIAVLPGTDPARRNTAFVITGHYDSISSKIMDPGTDAPGADDDASGVSVVVECARLLSGKRLRSTLIFAAVSGEEQGLLGSRRLVAYLAEKGYVIGGDLNNDIVGADLAPGGPHRVRLFSPGGDDGVDAPSRELARLVEDLDGEDHIRRIDRLDRFGRGGDQASFIRAGDPGVRFTEPLEDYHHEHQTPRLEGGVQYGDLPKFLDFNFMADVAFANATAASDLADAPAPPEAVEIAGAVTPNAVVRWSGSPDPERAGWEVLWRETTASRWALLSFAKEGTTEREFPGVSTDNHAFAVRAVGKNGALSIAVPGVGARRAPKK